MTSSLTATSTTIATSVLLTLVSATAATTASAQSQSSCQGEAAYRVTFASDWTANSANVAIPTNPHFSPMVVATHKQGWSSWSPDGLATPGIKLMAETGAPGVLKDEWSQAFNDGDIRAFRTGQRIDAGQSSTVELNAAADRPSLTMVSMIAPSPDWFVGVSGYSLCDQGEWLDGAEIALGPWDAGTDSGEAYTSADQATTPAQAITALDKDLMTSSGFGGAQYGTLIIERL